MAVRVTDNYGLAWNATIDDTDLNRTAQRIESRIGTMSGNVQQEGGKMDGMFKTLVAGAAAFFTAQQGAALISGLIKVRGEIQQLEIAFSTMLQSKEKADKLMAQAVDLAAKTPFGLQDVASGAKQLLAYGFAADGLMENITRLGNVASGVGSQLNDLIYLYGTLKASGRVTQMDINQFAGRGIPIYAELSKVLGVTVEKVRELVSSGGVNFTHVEKAFNNMTDKGGMFFNLMEAQSASLTGQISNLQDAIQSMFNEIGKSKEGMFSSGIAGLSYLVENYKQIGAILKTIITVYGTYRAALALSSAAEMAKIVGSKALVVAETAAALSGTKATAVTVLQAKATDILTAAQSRLAAVMKINPYMLLITVIASVAAGYYFLADRSSAAERAQKKLSERNEEAAKTTEDLKNKTNELNDAINSGVLSRVDQQLAFKKLQEIYPDLLGNMDMEEYKIKTLTEQHTLLNNAISNRGKSKLEEEYKAAVEAAKDLETITIDIENGATSTQDNTTSKEYKAAVLYAEELKKQLDEIKEAELLSTMTAREKVEYYKKQKDELLTQINQFEAVNGKLLRLKDGTISVKDNLQAWSVLGVITQFNVLIGKINSVKAAIGADGKVKSTVGSLEKDISDLEEKKKGASVKYGTGKWLDGTYKDDAAYYDKQIADKKKELNTLTGEKDKETAKSNKAASMAAKKSGEEQKRFLEQLGEAVRQQTINEKVEADKQIEVIQEKYRKMREEAIKAGFKKGSNVFDSISKMEDTEIGISMYESNTKALIEGLEKDRKAYEQYEQYKTDIGEDEARKRFGVEVDYLDKLQRIYDFTKSEDRTGVNEDRLLALRRLLDAETEHRADKEVSEQAKMITDYSTYEQKKKRLRDEYNSDMAKLSPELKAARTQQYNEDLAALKRNNSEKIAAMAGYTQEAMYITKQAAEQQLEIFNKALAQKDLPPDVRSSLQSKADNIANIINTPSRVFETKQIDSEIEKTQTALNAVVASGDTTTEVFKQLNDELMRLKQQKADIEISKLSSALNIINRLAPALQELSSALNESGGTNTWGEIASGMAAVASGASELNRVLKDIKVNRVTTGDAIVAGLQFALNVISTLVTASKRRKQEAEAFYLSAIGLQHDYNLALTDQIRLQAELSENVYLKDYFGRAKSGMQAAIRAAADYQKALDKLSEGKVKERQKDVVDGKTVGQLALSGAAAGAIVGSVLPGVGTVVGAAVGAVVGAVAGLFAKKKKDVYGGLLEEYPKLLKRGANGQREINKELAESLIKNDQLDAKTKTLVQNALDQGKALKDAFEQVKGVVADLSGSLGNDLKTALVNAWKAGEDGVKAFGDTVNNVLENILSNLIFHAAFNDLFEELQNNLAEDFVYGGTSDIVDSVGKFYQKAAERIPVFNAALDAANTMGEQYKLSPFGKTDGASKTNSMSNAIQQMTQQQADVLTGQFFAQTTVLNSINDKIPKGYFIGSLEMMAIKVETLREIKGDTGQMVVSLKNIDGKMNNTTNQAAAAGYKI